MCEDTPTELEEEEQEEERLQTNDDKSFDERTQKEKEEEALERSLSTGRAVCVGVSSDVLEAAATSTALMGSPVISEAATGDREMGSIMSTAAAAVASIVAGVEQGGAERKVVEREVIKREARGNEDTEDDAAALAASLRAEIEELKERVSAEKRRADRAERALAVLLGKEGEEDTA